MSTDCHSSLNKGADPNEPGGLGWLWNPINGGSPIAGGAGRAENVIFGDIDGYWISARFPLLLNRWLIFSGTANMTTLCCILRRVLLPSGSIKVLILTYLGSGDGSYRDYRIGTRSRQERAFR
jgi:hypothetical protein